MQDRKDLKRLDIRRDDIMIQQYSTVEYLACVLDESLFGESMAEADPDYCY